MSRLKVYIDPRDWWVGFFFDLEKGRTYFCPLPTVVLRWTWKAAA